MSMPTSLNTGTEARGLEQEVDAFFDALGEIAVSSAELIDRDYRLELPYVLLEKAIAEAEGAYQALSQNKTVEFQQHLALAVANTRLYVSRFLRLNPDKAPAILKLMNESVFNAYASIGRKLNGYDASKITRIGLEVATAAFDDAFKERVGLRRG